MENKEIEKLKQYLRHVLEVEMDVYTQRRMIASLENKRKGLGHAKNINVPKKEETESVFEHLSWLAMLLGFGGAIIGGIIGLIVPRGLFDSILGAGLGILIGAGSGLSISLIIAIIIKCVQEKRAQDKYDIEYQNYKKLKDFDQTRVKGERQVSELMNMEVKIIEQRKIESERFLKGLYSYNILHSEYRNVCAVAAIYSYLDKGITQSLKFDSGTGDKGAYALYEEDLRWGKAYSLLNEIIKRLDTVIENQQILVHEIRKANRNIENLNASFEAFAKNQVKHNLAMEANAERIEEHISNSEYYVKQAFTYTVMRDWMNENY